MDQKIREGVLEILERELYGYNEGCVGSHCRINVLGKEKAAQKIAEFIAASVNSGAPANSGVSATPDSPEAVSRENRKKRMTPF